MNVLYTSLLYKNKKIKSWTDGTLKSFPGKCELYDEMGNIIDTTWKSLPQDESTFTMDKYLVDLQNDVEIKPVLKKRKYRPLTLSKKVSVQISPSPKRQSPKKQSTPQPSKRVAQKQLKTCFSSWKSDSEDCSDSQENNHSQGIQIDLFKDSHEILESPINIQELQTTETPKTISETLAENILISRKNPTNPTNPMNPMNLVEPRGSQGDRNIEKDFGRIIFPNSDETSHRNSQRNLCIPIKFSKKGICIL